MVQYSNEKGNSGHVSQRPGASGGRRKDARSISGGHRRFNQSRPTEDLQHCWRAVCVAPRSIEFRAPDAGTEAPDEEKGERRSIISRSARARRALPKRGAMDRPQRNYTGFPSAPEEHRRPALNLHTLLAPRPLYTFFARHTGDAMTGANIFDDDLLVIERTSDYADGHIVLAFVDGERLVRRFERRDGLKSRCLRAGRSVQHFREGAG